jgi:hypothetical protein
MKQTRSARRTPHRALNARSEPQPEQPATAAPGLATKGDEVEEWLDLHFFRPLGAQIARRLAGTRATADQVTLISLVIGLAAGHLFLYASPWLNAAGFVLFIISDIFDSADGQLARIRGASTPFGRVLDGISDTARFVNLGVHLVVRLVLIGHWNWLAALTLTGIAGFSHSTQSATIDFMRHAFLALGMGRGSELDVDETDLTSGSWLRRSATRVYQAYNRRQRHLFPRTFGALRAQNEHRWNASQTGAYRAQIGPLIPHCAWLGQNLRFIVLGITAVAGWPAGLLWATVGPMNLVLFWLRGAQEDRAARILGAADLSRPSSPASPALAIGGE